MFLASVLDGYTGPTITHTKSSLMLANRSGSTFADAVCTHGRTAKDSSAFSTRIH